LVVPDFRTITSHVLAACAGFVNMGSATNQIAAAARPTQRRRSGISGLGAPERSFPRVVSGSP